MIFFNLLHILLLQYGLGAATTIAGAGGTSRRGPFRTASQTGLRGCKYCNATSTAGSDVGNRPSDPSHTLLRTVTLGGTAATTAFVTIAPSIVVPGDRSELVFGSSTLTAGASAYTSGSLTVSLGPSGAIHVDGSTITIPPVVVVGGASGSSNGNKPGPPGGDNSDGGGGGGSDDPNTPPGPPGGDDNNDGGGSGGSSDDPDTPPGPPGDNDNNGGGGGGGSDDEPKHTPKDTSNPSSTSTCSMTTTVTDYLQTCMTSFIGTGSQSTTKCYTSSAYLTTHGCSVVSTTSTVWTSNATSSATAVPACKFLPRAYDLAEIYRVASITLPSWYDALSSYGTMSSIPGSGSFGPTLARSQLRNSTVPFATGGITIDTSSATTPTTTLTTTSESASVGSAVTSSTSTAPTSTETSTTISSTAAPSSVETLPLPSLTTGPPVSIAPPKTASRVDIVFERAAGFGTKDYWDVYAYESASGVDYCEYESTVRPLHTKTKDGQEIDTVTPHPNPKPTLPSDQVLVLGDLAGGQTACQYSAPDGGGGQFECGTGLTHVVDCTYAVNDLNSYYYQDCYGKGEYVFIEMAYCEWEVD